jgi:DNA polymerase III alpha subunit (gram-positive type)
MSHLVFLDTETTGLDASKHEVWELAYAVDDEPIVSLILPHSLRKADPKALGMNGYYERVLHGTPINSESDRNDIVLRNLFQGCTLVCSNPTFDRMFLWMRWGEEPWHHRSIAIETMALTVFDWQRPRGLADIVKELQTRKYDIPEPNHSAYQDVQALRAAYYALRSENNKYRIY